MKINKRSKRIFREHKGFYIGILLLIILSSGLFVAFKTSTTSIKESVKSNREICRIEDANFTFSRSLSDEEIATLEEDFDLTLQRSEYMDVPYDDKALIRLRPPYEKLNLYSVYEGKPPESPGEILVDRFFLKAQDLSIGDSITFKNEAFRICGILATPDYIGMLRTEADFMANGHKFGLAVVGREDFQRLSNEGVKECYSVVFKKANGKQLRQRLAESGMVLDWTDSENNIRISAFDGEIEAIIIMSNIAPLFIILVSGMIMAVIMGRMLKKEYATIGTLASMGYHKRELLRHYLTLPAVIALIGSGIGLVLGYFMAEPLEILSKAEYSVPAITLDFKAETILIAVLLPFLLMLSAASFSVLRALHMNPVILLKANSGNQKKGLLTQIIPYRKGSFRWRFKLKEVLSNLPRSGLMLGGVMVASVFILAGFIIDQSVDVLLNSGFDQIYDYEYQYIYDKPQLGEPQEGEPFMLSSFDYVKGDETYGATIVGIRKGSKYVTYRDMESNPIHEGQVAMSESVAKRWGVAKGDTISIKNHSNLKSYNLHVDVIADIPMGENIYMDYEVLNKMLGLDERTYIGVFSDKALDIDENLLMNVTTRMDGKEGAASSIAMFKGLLFVLSGFAGVIGIIVVYIVTLMLVTENSRNISMLKVMGYHDREISSLLLNSNEVLIGLGFLLAIPISITAMELFLNKLTANMYMAFNAELGFVQILIGLLFILIVYYGTLWVCRRKVLTINMADSLKGRE